MLSIRSYIPRARCPGTTNPPTRTKERKRKSLVVTIQKVRLRRLSRLLARVASLAAATVFLRLRLVVYFGSPRIAPIAPTSYPQLGVSCHSLSIYTFFVSATIFFPFPRPRASLLFLPLANSPCLPHPLYQVIESATPLPSFAHGSEPALLCRSSTSSDALPRTSAGTYFG